MVDEERSRVSQFIEGLSVQIESGMVEGYVELLPAREASYGDLSAELHPDVLGAFRRRGISRMYSHQAEAVDAVVAGENVVVATSTASGKSVCYQAPTLHAMATDRDARALYVFPTKALGHDQFASLGDLIGEAGIDCEVATYDGDTPRADRAEIRRRGRIIVTNFDMCQVSLLPQHHVWREFLRNLKLVVIDEAHFYRGVFGSHVAMIIRRMRRILREYGASPQFVLCSATIANVREHAERLVGLPFRVVTADGSPSGGRAFVLVDAAPIEQSSGLGINVQAAAYTAALMREDVKTLTFAHNRAGVERIVQYTQEYLTGSRAGRNRRADLERKVMPYRAGYLAEYRRDVEARLRSGALKAVVATNAMELGINVGTLDATVIAGFPGTIASSWQQAGRSGRDGERSLSLMLLRDNVVDAFYARHPEAFFSAASESAQVSVDNERIVGMHLECAAWERPLDREDFAIFGEGTLRDVARVMEGEGTLVAGSDGKRRLPAGVRNPAFEVNIRSSDSERFRLVNDADGRDIEEITRVYALRELYPGAVYSHKGQTYRVVDFSEDDLEARLVYLDERIYTTPEIDTQIDVLRDDGLIASGGNQIGMGRVMVTTQVTGYRERGLYMRNDAGTYKEVAMPALTFETMAAWFCQRQEGWSGDQAALHAIAHVGTAALAMLTMCDRRDLGASAVAEHRHTGRDTAFIYEQDMGGVGLVEFIRHSPDAFCARMREIVSSCRCDAGCPSCIDSLVCHDDVEDPSKEAMLDYLGG